MRNIKPEFLLTLSHRTVTKTPKLNIVDALVRLSLSLKSLLTLRLHRVHKKKSTKALKMNKY